jgi:ERCC4-type nuclease
MISTQSLPLIIIDERERGSVREVFKSFPCRTQLETLDMGDYQISDSIIIERKRGDDLTASICDNRLFTQLLKLKKNFAYPMIILENPSRMFNGRNVYEASIYGALVYASYRIGIPIIPVRDEMDTGRVIWSLAKHTQKTGPFIFTKKVLQWEISREDQKVFLQGFSDIGDLKADALLDEFKTPEGVIKAILDSKIDYTSGGKPKGISGPLSQLKGFGTKFLQSNHTLLLTSIKDAQQDFREN